MAKKHTVTSQSSATKHRAKRTYQITASSPNRVWAAVGHGHYDSSFHCDDTRGLFAQTQFDSAYLLGNKVVCAT